MTYYDDELYHYDDELYHHGVKGMKWGVRRFRRSVGNGISRIRRKGQAFYKKHKTGIRRAAIGAGVAGLAAGAYALDRRFNGGKGAKAISGAAKYAYGKAANSRAGQRVAGAYNKVRSGASSAYGRASNAFNSKMGDYFNNRANKMYRKGANAHNRAFNYANGSLRQKGARDWASDYAKAAERNAKRARKFYSRGSKRRYLPTVRG